MRSTGSQTVVIDDVFVPDAAVALVRPADEWHPIWSAVVGAALPLIMSVYVSIAERAVEVALGELQRRGAASFPLIGEMMNAATTTADTVAVKLDSSNDLRFDNTEAHAAATLQRKTIASQAAIETVRLAIEVLGGAGFSRSLPLERLYRDVHGCLFHPLPRSRQLELSARVALDLPPVG